MDKTFSDSDTLFIEQSQSVSISAFKLGYRPELDGLRGISILLVFVHHLYFTLIPGGFLGVDIFFVLSGFLITTLLMQEWNRTGDICLRNFYARRFLRLMPAVFAMAAALGVFALLFLDNEKAGKTTQGIWLTLSYSSNWFYALNYISADNPLGVTWSLAIEEQFYVVFPLLLLLTLKSRAGKQPTIYVIVLAILGIAIYRIMLATQGVGIARLYYASDMRADAILMGCLTALLMSWNLIPQHSKRFELYIKLSALLATIFLGYLILTIDWTDYFLYGQGGYTMIAASVAVILIVILIYPPKLILMCLQFSPLVWIGRVSYGLYLWHWAVRYFLYDKQILPQSIFQLMLAIFLSLLLTAISYYFVEKPFLSLKERFSEKQVN